MTCIPRTRAGQARAREEGRDALARKIDNERNSRLRLEVADALLSNPEAGLGAAVDLVAESNRMSRDDVRAIVRPEGYSW